MNTRRARWILVASLVVVAAGYGLYRLGVHRGTRHATAGSSTASPSGERKPLYWHDPMMPQQHFDQPGKSPFMDMQLVPVYADDAGEAGGMRVSPRVQQNLGVRTAVVVSGHVSRTLEGPASIAFDERQVRVLEARAAGFVERVHVRATLDRIRRGQSLADLYSPDWVAAQEEFLTVKRLGATAGAALLDAARQRMRLVGMSERHIQEVETSERVQPRLSVVSPVDGVISELGAREGMTVAPGALLFRINGLGTVWVTAEVPESAAGSLPIGTPAEVRTPALPGTVFRARVSALPPTVALETRTRAVRLELGNPRGELVPGMFATVRFTQPTGAATLLVPTEAIIETGARTVVVVAEGNGSFSPVEVERGREGDGQTEILKGLTAGQRIVVSGQFLLDSEATLTGTAQRMSGAPDAAGVPQPPGAGTEPRP